MSTKDQSYRQRLTVLAGESPEFPDGADADLALGGAEISRRRFLKQVSAGAALAALSSCKPSRDGIVPYVRAPRGVVPGVAQFYASAITDRGIARGVLVESHMGRPTRLRGNPSHPESQGACDSRTQAEILTLYHPDRLKGPRSRKGDTDWASFFSSWNSAPGNDIRILSIASTSPLFSSVRERFLERFPNALWHWYEPAGRDRVYAGTRKAFGAALHPIYHLENAELVVTVGADIFSDFPGALRYSRDVQQRRNRTEWCWLYSLESAPTLAGARADRRFAAAPIEAERVLSSLYGALREHGGADATPDLSQDGQSFVREVTEKLRAAGRGRSVMIPGEYESAEAQALAHRINASIGSIGQTVTYTPPIEQFAEAYGDSLGALVDALEHGEVDRLLIIGGDPVYSRPDSDRIAHAISQARLSAHLTLFSNETSRACAFQLPMAHELEQWGDARSYDTAVALQQPLIEPMYGSKSPVQLVSELGRLNLVPRDLLREHWAALLKEEDPLAWERCLHDGVVPKSVMAPITPTPLEERPSIHVPPTGTGGIALVFRPDPTIGDGRSAKNSWLQELPKPFTKLTWENAVLISPATGAEQKVVTGDWVRLINGSQTLEGPVFVLPGVPPGVAVLNLGYGQAGVADAQGANAYRLLPSNGTFTASGAQLERLDKPRHSFSTTQGHYQMEGRDLVRVSPRQAHGSEDSAAEEKASLYFLEPAGSHQWAMSIDLNACTGCSACVTACQSENNIPTVGRAEVLRGREMFWIRVDQYNDDKRPNRVYSQPVPCMHCEQAPCELVCPVAATVHSAEGLNEMVYNRCVGTRFCSNNCPYKVRRFNFFHYTDEVTPVLAKMQNPDVTVRGRGVMEKCSYCVQRIERARIERGRVNKPIADGDVRTACQEACPTEAIVFGDLRDPTSRVSRRKANPLDYGLLTELNTRPRTTYLPVLVDEDAAAAKQKEKGGET